MTLPLPTELTDGNPVPGSGHPGLRWDKFFDQWDDGFSGFTDSSGGKSNWIRQFCRKWGDKKALKAAVHTRDKMFAALSVRSLRVQLQTPFVTGLGYEHPVENDFLWHHTLGVPYLPGSSIKGLMHAWARDYQRCNDVDRLFGSSAQGAGTLIVFEAIPIEPVSLICEIIAPHDGGWRHNTGVTPSDWNSPKPIPFLAAAPGAEFQFALGVRSGSQQDDLADGIGLLTNALDWLGAGAKTNIGFGQFLTKEAIVTVEARRRQNWRPVPGADALLDGQRVTVLALNGDLATVDSREEPAAFEVEITELKPIE